MPVRVPAARSRLAEIRVRIPSRELRSGSSNWPDAAPISAYKRNGTLPYTSVVVPRAVSAGKPVSTQAWTYPREV